MTKLIGYDRVSTKAQEADLKIQDLLAAGVRRVGLYTDHGQSGALAKRPGLDKALQALHPEDTLVITNLDWLGRSTQKMLELVQELREHNIGLRVINLGGGDVDTKTPVGRWFSPSWQLWLKWNCQSNANGSPTRSPNAALLAAISAAAGPLLLNRRSEPRQNSFSPASRQPRSPRGMGMSRVVLYRRIKELP